MLYNPVSPVRRSIYRINATDINPVAGDARHDGTFGHLFSGARFDRIPLDPATVNFGGWYDADDISTLWQDHLRTTPVTATGQTVGAMDDKTTNAIHLFQSDNLKKPTYLVDGGGVGYLEFSTGDNLQEAGSSIVPEESVWFALAFYSAATDIAVSLFGATNLGNRRKNLSTAIGDFIPSIQQGTSIAQGTPLACSQATVHVGQGFFPFFPAVNFSQPGWVELDGNRCFYSIGRGTSLSTKFTIEGDDSSRFYEGMFRVNNPPAESERAKVESYLNAKVSAF